VVPFHFSPRYADRENDLRGELEAARTANDERGTGNRVE